MQSRPDWVYGSNSDLVTGSDPDLAILSILDLAPQSLPDVTSPDSKIWQFSRFQIWHSHLSQI